MSSVDCSQLRALASTAGSIGRPTKMGGLKEWSQGFPGGTRTLDKKNKGYCVFSPDGTKYDSIAAARATKVHIEKR